MSTIFSNPRVATLSRTYCSGMDVWIIVATTPVDGFTALHEVDLDNTVPAVIETITISTSWELEIFRADLNDRG